MLVSPFKNVESEKMRKRHMDRGNMEKGIYPEK